MARSKWSSPLYASGREWLWSERSWEQGSTTAMEDVLKGAEGVQRAASSPERDQLLRWATEEAMAGDVPSFLRAAHSLARSDDFACVAHGTPNPQ